VKNDEMAVELLFDLMAAIGLDYSSSLELEFENYNLTSQDIRALFKNYQDCYYYSDHPDGVYDAELEALRKSTLAIAKQYLSNGDRGIQ